MGRIFRRHQARRWPAATRKAAPWTVVKADDKYRARIGAIQAVLSQIDYKGRDAKVAAAPRSEGSSAVPGLWDG